MKGNLDRRNRRNNVITATIAALHHRTSRHMTPRVARNSHHHQWSLNKITGIPGLL
jgi:hypothetical protein